MYIFGTVISVVCVMYALLVSIASENISSATAAVGDPVQIGFQAYDTAYQKFMEQYGSENRKIYPASNSDLFPAFGFYPKAPFGGAWQFALDSSGATPLPYACITVTVNGAALLESIKQAAYRQGASVIAGASCAGAVLVSGNLSDSAFPITVSAVKHYSGKSTKTLGTN